MVVRAHDRQRKVTVMSTKGTGFVLAAGVLTWLLAGAVPAVAESHGGGGHSSGGGSSGGGHSGGGYSGGGHSGGGGHASAGGNYGGGHYAAAGHYGGASYAHNYSAGFHGAYGHSGGYSGHPGGYTTHAGGGYWGHSGGGYGHSGGYYGHGYSTGAYWRGGYWHGGFWPRAYYGVGFSWFLPLLPPFYATYWYGGIPYYYANDVYYTYDPSYEGYVATDPPPVADSSGSGPPPNDGPAPNAGPAPGDGAGIAGQIFMYPKNGQSAEQQATDKAECQQWAAQQAGQVAQNGSDYLRAMTACVEGRGYSAR
jgi:hypothetical protein